MKLGYNSEFRVEELYLFVPFSLSSDWGAGVNDDEEFESRRSSILAAACSPSVALSVTSSSSVRSTTGSAALFPPSVVDVCGTVTSLRSTETKWERFDYKIELLSLIFRSSSFAAEKIFELEKLFQEITFER